MRALLIDSKKRTVAEKHIRGGDDASEIYDLIGCEYFDVLPLSTYTDLFVDDEGLLTMDEDTCFFSVDGGQPLAGNGLVLCHDGEGESIGTTMNVETMEARLCFMDAQGAKDMVYDAGMMQFHFQVS